MSTESFQVNLLRLLIYLEDFSTSERWVSNYCQDLTPEELGQIDSAFNAMGLDGLQPKTSRNADDNDRRDYRSRIVHLLESSAPADILEADLKNAGLAETFSSLQEVVSHDENREQRNSADFLRERTNHLLFPTDWE